MDKETRPTYSINGSTVKLEHWEPSTISCPKCGSNNTLVNTMFVLTSYPEQYGYKCKDCGHTWTAVKHYEIPPMPDWPDLEIEELKYNGNYGWICPKCGRVYAPHMNWCTNCGGPHSPNIVYCNDTSWTRLSSNPNVNGITSIQSNTITEGVISKDGSESNI